MNIQDAFHLMEPKIIEVLPDGSKVISFNLIVVDGNTIDQNTNNRKIFSNAVEEIWTLFQTQEE